MRVGFHVEEAQRAMMTRFGKLENAMLLAEAFIDPVYLSIIRH
jgi:hypothetical protein